MKAIADEKINYGNYSGAPAIVRRLCPPPPDLQDGEPWASAFVYVMV